MRSHSKLFYFLVTWQLTRTFPCGPAVLDPWTQEVTYFKDTALCKEDLIEYRWKDFPTNKEASDFIATQPLQPLSDINSTRVSNVNLTDITEDKYDIIDKVVDAVQSNKGQLPPIAIPVAIIGVDPVVP